MPDVGVRVYIAFTGFAVVLVRMSLSVDCAVPDAPPEKPDPVGVAHV
jgi:hypothetical protein